MKTAQFPKKNRSKYRVINENNEQEYIYLNKEEKAFCHHIHDDGLTPTEAVKAISPEISNNSASCKGYKWLRRNQISRYIKCLHAEKKRNIEKEQKLGLEELKQELDAKELGLEKLKQELDAKELGLEKLKQELDAKELGLEKLKQELDAKELEIDKKINMLNISDKMRNRYSYYANLEHEVKRLRQRIEELLKPADSVPW
ncbi:MAG: hypothetical protein OEZ01_01150 [Candidatus Heimdallarchaeota archaeon]|nr:hypothetical protein [Candidatus Heimdallarchaeota archaeon]